MFNAKYDGKLFVLVDFFLKILLLYHSLSTSAEFEFTDNIFPQQCSEKIYLSKNRISEEH